MRIKNKEIRRRRHRKEQKMKDAARTIRSQYSGEKKAVTAVAPKPKAAAPAKAPAPAKPTTAKKPAEDKTAEAKPKAAPKKAPAKNPAEAES